MLDGVSLDQLRAFIAAVDEGSFSAGARKLHRAQSAVSELVSNLEAQIGVMLFSIVPSVIQNSRPPAFTWWPTREASWPTWIYSRRAPKEFPAGSSRNSPQS